MINHVSIQGRFTRDLEKKETTNGVSVCNFTLAWNEKVKERENTLFLNCVAYRGTCDFITKYFKKGDMAVVEGKLTSRSYEKDGEKRYVTELIVDKVHFCGAAKKDDNGQEKLVEVESDDEFGEDLPF